MPYKTTNTTHFASSQPALLVMQSVPQQRGWRAILHLCPTTHNRCHLCERSRTAHKLAPAHLRCLASKRRISALLTLLIYPSVVRHRESHQGTSMALIQLWRVCKGASVTRLIRTSCAAGTHLRKPSGPVVQSLSSAWPLDTLTPL